MQWMKWTGLIIGSVWFFPVSCMSGLYVGPHIISWLDVRDATKGDDLHAQFSVVLESSSDVEPLNAVRLDELASYEEALKSSQTASDISYRVSKPRASFTTESSAFSYQVILENDGEQLIELVEARLDGDNTIWSRYLASPASITPVSSRMFYFGYLFTAVPYAFGVALFFYITGRLIRRRYKVADPQSS